MLIFFVYNAISKPTVSVLAAEFYEICQFAAKEIDLSNASAFFWFGEEE